MVGNDYLALTELDAAASEEYLDDLAREIASDENVDERISGTDIAISHGVTEGRFRPLLNVWALLWRQTGALIDAGIGPLPGPPFGGRAAKHIAKSLATKANGWIPPLPDEIALPVMAAAHRMIGVPANDIIRLQKLYLDTAAAASHLCTRYQGTLAGRAILGFVFSSLAGEDRPWRSPLNAMARQRQHKGHWCESPSDVHHALRVLIEDVCGACTIVLQSEAGIRINEVCGLKAGMNPATGLPACITARISKTGLHELFFLRGILAKTQSAPAEVEWLLGARPVGSNEVPAPERAVQILQELYGPMRSLGKKPSLHDHLIVQFTSSRSYSRNGQKTGRIHCERLLDHQRQFIRNYVDLSGLANQNRHGQDLSRHRDSKGACILSHSWRKTFALYVFRTDSRMIPAIAQQFQHLSLAMTEQGYIGSDPTLLEVMDSARVQQTALFFFEMARGVRPLAGRMGKLIDEHRAELGGIVAGADKREGLLAMERWVVKQDLRIWFASHGKCFLRLAPSQARCHLLGGTAHWTNREPNYAYRSPDVCLGCPVYAVDGDHEAFWVRRYLDNHIAWTKAVAGGFEKDYRIAEHRALQSAAVLQAIGVELPVTGTEATDVQTT